MSSIRNFGDIFFKFWINTPYTIIYNYILAYTDYGFEDITKSAKQIPEHETIIIGKDGKYLLLSEHHLEEYYVVISSTEWADKILNENQGNLNEYVDINSRGTSFVENLEMIIDITLAHLEFKVHILLLK